MPWIPSFTIDCIDPLTGNDSLAGSQMSFADWPPLEEATWTASEPNQISTQAQETGEITGTPESEEESEDSGAEIGTALRNGKFKCNQWQCAHKSFSRLPDLRRHHLTAHAIRKPEF